MKKILSLILVLCASLFTACAKKEEPVTTLFKGEHVVNSSYVKQKSEDENTILVHVKKEESNKTIDSAVSMDYDYLTKSITDDNDEAIIENIFDNKELSKKLGDLGLDKNKEIILFANDNSGIDGKILYQLLVAGYDYAKVVDGGYDSLINAGFEEGNPKKLEPIKINIDKIDDDKIITEKELKDNYEDFVVVSLDKDSDSKEVINLNYEDLFTKDKTLKSIKDIKILLKDLGIKSDDEIVIHSSDGIKSAYVQVILKMSGFEYSRYYDAAYSDSNDEKTVEKEVEKETIEVSDENTNEITNESTESTTKPNTNASTGSTTTKPNTNGSTGSTTTKPNTNGSTGSTTTKPNTNASTGSTTTKPNTNGSSGSTTTKPGTGGSTGSTTTKPGTGGSSGSTTSPGTGGGTGSTTKPDTDGSTGGSTTKPDTDNTTGSTTKPETGGNNTGSSDVESSIEE